MPKDVGDVIARVKGTKWSHLGRSSDGADCAGCVQLVLGEFGIDCRLPTAYPLRWWRSQPNKIAAHAHALGWAMIRNGQAAPLDVLAFSLSTTHGDHLGVFVGEGKFIHCWTEQASVVSLTDDLSRSARWIDRLVSVIRPTQ